MEDEKEEMLSKRMDYANECEGYMREREREREREKESERERE